MDSPLPPPPPKGGALKWILLGCGTLFVVAAIGIGLGVFFLVRAVGGTEVASAPGTINQESTVTYQVTEAVPHALWLEYSVSIQGGDFRLEGPIVVRSAAGVLAQDALTLGADGPATAAGFGRVVMSSSQMIMNGQGTSSARIRLLEIPPQAPGTTVTAGVTIVPRPGTTVTSLRLVITR